MWREDDNLARNLILKESYDGFASCILHLEPKKLYYRLNVCALSKFIY